MLHERTTGYDAVASHVLRRRATRSEAAKELGATDDADTFVSDEHRLVAACIDPPNPAPFRFLLPLKVGLSILVLLLTTIMITSDVGLQGVVEDVHAFRLSSRQRQLRRVVQNRVELPRASSAQNTEAGQPVYLDAVSGQATTTPPTPFTAVPMTCLAAVPTRRSVWCVRNASEVRVHPLDPIGAVEDNMRGISVRDATGEPFVLLDAAATSDGPAGPEVAVLGHITSPSVELIVCPAVAQSCAPLPLISLLDSNGGPLVSSATLRTGHVFVTTTADESHIIVSLIVTLDSADASVPAVHLIVAQARTDGSEAQFATRPIANGIASRPYITPVASTPGGLGTVGGTLLQRPHGGASPVERGGRIVPWTARLSSTPSMSGISYVEGTALDCVFELNRADAITFHAPMSTMIPSAARTHPLSVLVMDASGPRFCSPLPSVLTAPTSAAPPVSHRSIAFPRRHSMFEDSQHLAAGLVTLDRDPALVVAAQVRDSDGAVSIDVMRLDGSSRVEMAVRVAELPSVALGSSSVRLAITRETVVVVVRSGDVQLVPIAKWSLVGTAVKATADHITTDLFVPWGRLLPTA